MNDIMKPIERMTDEELLAIAESLESEAREHQEHSNELRAYLAARNVNERAA